MPYFYLKLVLQNRGIKLTPMPDLLIPATINLGKQLGVEAVRIHPISTMYNILKQRYGFVDVDKDAQIMLGIPFGLIATGAPEVVIKFI